MANSSGNGGSEDSLTEEAGAIIFARVAANGRGETGRWHCLNAGRLRIEDNKSGKGHKTPLQYTAAKVCYPPLRGSYVNGRRSVRADYDNRPLVAISRKENLIQVPEAKLVAPTDQKLESDKVDYLWPADGKHFLPALRYYGHEKSYVFMWVTLKNACCLPEGFWKQHPALLDVDNIPLSPKERPDMQVSKPDYYLRRVGIALPRLQVSGTLDVNGNWSSEPPPNDGADIQTVTGWPALPVGVHPISAEIEVESDPDDFLLGEQDTGPVGHGRNNAPLALLFPRGKALSPAYVGSTIWFKVLNSKSANL